MVTCRHIWKVMLQNAKHRTPLQYGLHAQVKLSGTVRPAESGLRVRFKNLRSRVMRGQSNLHIFILFTELYFTSSPPVVQVVLSTAHPAKFSEAVTKGLSTLQGFDFERDVLPQQFRGLLEKERRVVDVDEPNKELVKKVIENKVGSAGNGV
jgi:hypothetical protein